MNRAFVAVLAALAGVLVAAGPATAAPATQPAANAGFVTRTGSTLKLDGKPFRFGGTNNYYLFYSSRAMVDDVFADAQAAGFDVMRTWAFGLIGNADVRVLWVYLNPGTVDLDNVRLE
jgi:mannan endo-1,4-beta-mannosidase